ncbi:MAG: hypothetical protein HY890_04030 [Deltaproteobacteria bacterium]|nr:hypothetical protein [Deltaproteobacteria bacterium]
MLAVSVAGCGGGGGAESSNGSDDVNPFNASVTINDGDDATSSIAVTLTLSAVDSAGVAGFYASESSAAPAASDSGWTTVATSASYSGTASFTFSTAPGTKTVYIWFQDGAGNVSDAVSDTITLSSSEVSGLAGTWGYQTIRYDPVDGWYVELAKAAFNGDGTGSITGHWNDNGTLGSGVKAFTYLTGANSDGSFTMNINVEGSVNSAKWVMSDGGNMIVADGTEMFGPTAQGLMSLVKLDGAAVLTSADFSGQYYTFGYGYKAAEGSYRATSTSSTADGAGTLDVHGTRNNNGAIDSSSAMVTYEVQGEKINLSSGTALILSGDNNIAVAADAFNYSDYEGGFFMKRGSGYSTLSIEGTWAIAGFGDDDNGTSFIAAFGTMTCTAAGACTLSLKNQADGAASSASSSMNIAVDADGSFGASISADSPVYAGAIGNGGNTIMFNVSFDGASLNHREVFLGVRCTQCADLSAF